MLICDNNNSDNKAKERLENALDPAKILLKVRKRRTRLEVVLNLKSWGIWYSFRNGENITSNLR